MASNLNKWCDMHIFVGYSRIEHKIRVAKKKRLIKQKSIFYGLSAFENAYNGSYDKQ